MSRYVHKIYRRLPYPGNICSWVKLPKAYLLRPNDQVFFLTEQESWDLQNRFIKGPVDFELFHYVTRPGGSVHRPEYGVRFFHRPSAMLFKLSRVVDTSS